MENHNAKGIYFQTIIIININSPASTYTLFTDTSKPKKPNQKKLSFQKII